MGAVGGVEGSVAEAAALVSRLRLSGNAKPQAARVTFSSPLEPARPANPATAQGPARINGLRYRGRLHIHRRRRDVHRGRRDNHRRQAHDDARAVPVGAVVMTVVGRTDTDADEDAGLGGRPGHRQEGDHCEDILACSVHGNLLFAPRASINIGQGPRAA